MGDEPLASIKRRVDSPLPVRAAAALFPWLLAPAALWPRGAVEAIFAVLAIIDCLVAIVLTHTLTWEVKDLRKPSFLLRPDRMARFYGWLLFVPSGDVNKSEKAIFRILIGGLGALSLSIALRIAISGF
jgi:hypothetical protein